MRINEVEKAVGIAKKNIRFYEEQGLLSPRREQGNGYRDYSEEDVRTLQMIRLLRKLSVPIEEIRKLQSGALSLQDCMCRHGIYLNRQLRNLNQIQVVCQELGDSGVSLSALDVDAWESRMAQMEAAGTRFMNVSNDKQKKKTGPIIAAAVCMAFVAALLGFFIWAWFYDPIPWPILLLIGIPLVCVLGGILLALRERMKEIDRGESDEAAKY